MTFSELQNEKGLEWLDKFFFPFDTEVINFNAKQYTEWSWVGTKYRTDYTLELYCQGTTILITHTE